MPKRCLGSLAAACLFAAPSFAANDSPCDRAPLIVTHATPWTPTGLLDSAEDVAKGSVLFVKDGRWIGPTQGTSTILP
jgi:hypothetical protein